MAGSPPRPWNIIWAPGTRQAAPAIPKKNGFVGGLTYGGDIDEESAFETILEVAYFNNLEVQVGDALYTTVGGVYSVGPWFATASYTLRDLETSVSADHLAQASVGYVFDFGMAVEVGYKFDRQDGVKINTVGGLVSYQLEF
jgi:hypothetical protein